MAYNDELEARLKAALKRKRGITSKNMFGGMGFLLHGHTCVGIWKDSLIVRIGKDQYDEAVREANTSPFDITGKTMRGWLMVSREGWSDDAVLQDWIERSVKFVKTLDPKQ